MNPWTERYDHRDELIRAYTAGVQRARDAYYGAQIDAEQQRAKAVKQAARMREHRARRKQQLREAEEASWTGTT